MGLMGLMGRCSGGAAAGTPPGCTVVFFGVGGSVGYSVGVSVGVSVGESNFVFLDAVFFFFSTQRDASLCVFRHKGGAVFKV